MIRPQDLEAALLPGEPAPGDGWWWGTVTAVSPLRVRRDGEGAPLPVTPEAMTGTLLVGDRVRCHRAGKQLVVFGRRDGRLPGEVIAYAGPTPPPGWLICDGSAISRATYPDLFAVLGTTYGPGNGTTTFNLPDLRGRVAVGVSGSDAEFNAAGNTGGAKTHTLTIAEMPSHTHPVRSFNAAAGTHGHTRTDGVAQGASTAATEADIATKAAGSGAAHNNLPPYLTVRYLIHV